LFSELENKISIQQAKLENQRNRLRQLQLEEIEKIEMKNTLDERLEELDDEEAIALNNLEDTYKELEETDFKICRRERYISKKLGLIYQFQEFKLTNEFLLDED
jgi:hypothetical protein